MCIEQSEMDPNARGTLGVEAENALKKSKAILRSLMRFTQNSFQRLDFLGGCILDLLQFFPASCSAFFQNGLLRFSQTLLEDQPGRMLPC